MCFVRVFVYKGMSLCVTLALISKKKRQNDGDGLWFLDATLIEIYVQVNKNLV